jgi:hypothetical protein
MTDITADCEIRDAIPNLGIKTFTIVTPATADGADTIVKTLASMGMQRFLGVLTFIHSTTDSVIALETTDACTSAVSSGTLTLTIGGSTSNKVRTIVVLGM